MSQSKCWSQVSSAVHVMMIEESVEPTPKALVIELYLLIVWVVMLIVFDINVPGRSINRVFARITNEV
jgi:hypothetical protein